MECIECGHNTEKILKKYVVELNDCVLIIKNVPTYICPHCAEAYYDDDVAAKLEKIAMQFEKTMQEVAIIEYNKAA